MAVAESQVAATELEKVIPKVRVLFERDDKFYANIKKRDVEKISHRQMRVPLELRPGGSFQYFNPDGGDLGSRWWAYLRQGCTQFSVPQ